MSEETKKLPPRKLSFTVSQKTGDNTYEVEYPNTGQSLQIQYMRISLSRDTYDSLVVSATEDGQIARYTIDMIAFLSTCCPQIKKDLNVANFADLGPLENKKLLKIYAGQIMPWLAEWGAILNAPDEEINKDEQPAT